LKTERDPLEVEDSKTPCGRGLSSGFPRLLDLEARWQAPGQAPELTSSQSSMSKGGDPFLATWSSNKANAGERVKLENKG
jgi:hypothetical protein